MLLKHFSISASTARHDPCTPIFGYLSTSLIHHKHSFLPSVHRQPIMTHVPQSLAIYQLHPCFTNILPSLHRQPIMTHVPQSLAVYQPPMHNKHSSIPPLSTAHHDPCTTVIGYWSTSLVHHKHSSIPPSTAYRDSCTTIFGNHSTPRNWSIF